MITPMDIHNKTFSRQLRGYSQEEVNSFLEELASDYEKIYREHREIEEEMDMIKTKLRNYEKMEATMSSTLVMAQETAENVKRAAQKEAELYIREAKAKANKIIADSENARRQINADLIKTEGDLNLYIEKILSNFKSAFALIESCKKTPAPKIIEEPETAPHQEDVYVEEIAVKEHEEKVENSEVKEVEENSEVKEKAAESNE